MKKITTGILALALAASMSLPAFAAETNNGGNTTADVNGVYRAGAEAPATVSADITWDEMNFTYSESQKVWNPETHQYEQAPGVWSSGRKNITITNHSNVSIMVGFNFDSAVAGLVGGFTTNSMTLESAVGKAPEEAPTQSAGFGIAGGIITESRELGTITVTVMCPDHITSADGVQLTGYMGGDFRLGSDITAEKRFLMYKDFTLDLNGKTIKGDKNGLFDFNGTHTLKNGTVSTSGIPYVGAWINKTADVTLENCTLSANNYYAVYAIGGKVTLKDCTLIGEGSGYPRSLIYIEGASILTLCGKITMSATGITRFGGTVICLEGEYNFDPTEYVDTESYDITKAGGIWTVAAK